MLKTQGKPLRQQLQKLVDVEKTPGENLYVIHFTTNDKEPLKILSEWLEVSRGGTMTLVINPTIQEDMRVFMNGTTFFGVQTEVSHIISQINYRRGISPTLNQNHSTMWDIVQPFDLMRMIRKIKNPPNELQHLTFLRWKTKYICTLKFHFPTVLVRLHVMQN